MDSGRYTLLLLRNYFQHFLKVSCFFHQVCLIISNKSYMPYLSSWFCFLYNIYMKIGIGHVQHFPDAVVTGWPLVRLFTNKVNKGGWLDQFCIPQRVIKNDATENIVLRAVIGFDSMMTTVMYPR